MPRIHRRILGGGEIASPTLTAAATHIDTTSQKATRHITTSGWKKHAWDMYDQVGELRYICQWLSNALSRVKLYAADIDTTGRPTLTPTTNPAATTIVTDIAGGPAGQAAMLSRLATFLTVPGEGWITVILRHTPTGDTEEWHVLSADEITTRGTSITLRLGDGTDHDFNPDTDILTRIHRPHPRDGRESDSPVHAALPILTEIVRMSQAIEGAAKSRLMGNGMLLLPTEISMPVAEPPRADPDAPDLPTPDTPLAERKVTAQDVMAQLQHVMTTAIQDPTSAAATVPIVLKAPGDTLDKIRHLTFESEVTETSLKTRDAAIKRLALSLDIPAEVLTGIGSTNHWNAWAIDESAIKTHIAPMMTIICDALTEAVLRPLLKDSGTDPDSVTVWYDLKDLTQKPNRSDDAIAAFDRGAINAVTLRRELGFSDDDAPEAALDEAGKRQLAVELVKGAPSLIPMLAPILGLPIDTTATVPAATPAPTTPILHPNNPPEQP